ncbi:sensor histidine kinase [Blautia hominis]|uniref:Sensor histidine kinase n=2 Tax=Blautia hominis TaxID=2025493 RepID=A0ABQ0BE04_9FIRM
MRKKIIYLFVGCFIVFILSMLIILHSVYSKQLYSELTKRSDYEDGLIIQQLDNLTQNIESCCNNVIMEINISMTKRELKDSSTESTKEKLLKVTEDNFLLFKEVSEISILYNTGELFTKVKNGGFSFSADNIEFVEEMKSTDVNTSGMWYQRDGEGEFIYFLKYLNEIKGNNQVGYIILKIDEDTIYKNFKGKKTDGISQIFVFDEAGYLLSTNQREILKEVHDKNNVASKLSLSQQIYESLIHKTKEYQVQEYTNQAGWNIVTVLDTRQGMKNLGKISSIVMMGSGLFLIVFLIMVLVVLKKILRPVVAIGNHMRLLGANPLSKIDLPDTSDEIGYLVSSFNQMVDMNKVLIDQVKEDEREKRRLELALLQMQIKPHFLYNTLDTAFCLNEIGMNKEASRVIKQLAGYYRLVLNHGSEWISLGEELGAVEKYLEIQAVRYSDVISYKIMVDEELYGFQIPKMTLQPLVENAIYHGIKPTGKPGHIIITGELCEDEVTLSVVDDGAGMSKAYFADVLKGKRISTDKESFGLKNVAERLKLFYGDNASIALDEDNYLGTSIFLTINWRKDENN